ncbi:hypothetical protein AB0G05_01990 [Nonomuraea wenchangensis]
MVPAERTVPYLLPESDYFATLPSVLATGYLVGIVEWTCMRALDGHLEDGEQAELSAVDGRQLTFTVRAHDDATTVCRGTHRRAVIDTDRFHARLRAR